MVGLPDGEKTLRTCVIVYTQYRRVTDRHSQMDRQTSCHGIVRAMHTRRAVKRKNGYAYHVWTTSINAFVSYPAHKQRTMTNRTNDLITRSAKMAFSLCWMAVLLLSVCTL